MRHKLSRNRLNRFTSWRDATVNSLVRSLFISERITTTRTKAKAAQKLAEKLITLAKKDELASKRRAYRILCDHKLVQRLFKEIGPRYKDTNGGYTRIIRLGSRRGDSAKTVIFELTKRVEKKLKTHKKTQKEKGVKTEETIKETKKQDAIKNSSDVKDSKEQKKKEDTFKAKKEEKPEDKNFLGGIKKLFNKKKHRKE
ncbi:MAG: 50S ribosomal protein L17 [Candidatus Gygaella obscura]|nr:50S ribosomal protein L17 [Candidatus Gygaella obscura]